LRQARYGDYLLALFMIGVAADAAQPLPASAAVLETPARASAAGPATLPQSAVLPSLADTVTALEALESTEDEIGKRLAAAKSLDSQRTELDTEEQALSAVQRPGAYGPQGLSEFFVLSDLASALRASDRRLTAAIETLSSTTKAFDADLDRLAAYDAQATQWLQTAHARDAPAALIARIEAVPKRSAKLAQDARAKRDQALELLSHATRLSARAKALRSEVGDRRLQLEAQMRTARAEPLWRTGTDSAVRGRAFESARAETSQIVDFLVAHAVVISGICIAAFVLAFLLVVTARSKLAKLGDSFGKETPRLFEAPATAALMLTLLTLVWLVPAGPSFYYNVVFSLMPIPAALLARAVFAHGASLSLFMLTAAMISLGLVGPIVDPLPLEGCLLLIAQCVAVSAGLVVDLRRGALVQAVRWSPVTTRRVAIAVIALLMLAVVAAVAGYVGPARVLRNVVLGAIGLGLLVFIATHLLYGLVAVLSETRAAQWLRIVSRDPASLRRAALTALTIVGWIAWVVGMLVLVGRLDWFVQLADDVVAAKFEIGAATVSSAAIFAGLAVLAGTYALARIMRPVLDIELLPRLRLERGVSFAISAVIRYSLITAGVLLAMAAMGIDLTKVTLLAGAIGVGVGLGLQGVVNNFVSGLILLVERPITAGDAVQIGDTNGIVRSIGVRASTIRTSQGAEVIIPNADLISKAVTNWTLTDRKRGVEIDVDVAREAEAESVIRLLEQAAADVTGISAKPAPRAWLNGLGADRKYRLQSWIDDGSRAVEFQSRLRMAIAKRFTEAGVEIK